MSEPTAPARQPKNAIIILLDSLNRHMIGAYGGREFATPNLDAFARRSLRFNRCYTGSLPCMPARHDLLCGTLDFLWRPWGSIEIWEQSLTAHLSRAGVTSMLISDHPHLFETGGENYHTDFSGWDYLRGHEGDLWKTRPDESWIGTPPFRAADMPYHRSRGYFKDESDFPGPKTMAAAAQWIDENAGYHDRFFLLVDEFDPHEPFDTPEPYLSMYDKDWEGEHLIWPPYAIGAVAQGILTERQARQVRACYGGKLTMIDTWFGKLIEAIDRNNLWEDTAVIACTDHGHYLGEKDIWGKPQAPVLEPLGHIPLMVAWPGVQPGETSALTTMVDTSATLAEIFDVEPGHHIHGKSLVPLIRGEKTSIREYVLTGVWGRQVNIVHDRYKYSRSPAGPNAPLSMWSNRWSTMPLVTRPGAGRMPRPDDRAFLDRMPGSNVPVIRQPYEDGDRVPYWSIGPFDGNHLYDVLDDPGEERNLAGTPAEKEMADKLREALREIEAPDDQFVRLGLE